MAGMLPGVESARRRRCRGPSAGWPDLPSSSSSGSSNSSRRSSLCLYTTSHNSLLSSNSNLQIQERNTVNNYNREQQEDHLGGAAKKAKERLDERLRAQYRKLQAKTGSWNSRRDHEDRNEESSASTSGGGLMVRSSLSSKMMRSWKCKDQVECAVCLEKFKSSDEDLEYLPCAHRFHSKCLLPWLQNNAHCPCCRNPI